MIYCFLATGFEETEAVATLDILRRAGVEVTVTGLGGKLITGAHGVTLLSDVEAEKADFSNMTGIFLPGGMPGALNLEKSDIVQKALQQCIQNDLYILAICAAPSILGKQGILNKRKATCYMGYERYLLNADFTGDPVTVDGKIITGRSAGVTIDFALTAVSEISGRETADLLRSALDGRKF